MYTCTWNVRNYVRLVCHSGDLSKQNKVMFDINTATQFAWKNSSSGETARNLWHTHYFQMEFASPQAKFIPKDDEPETPCLSPLRVLQDFSEQRHRDTGVEFLPQVSPRPSSRTVKTIRSTPLSPMVTMFIHVDGTYHINHLYLEGNGLNDCCILRL